MVFDALLQAQTLIFWPFWPSRFSRFCWHMSIILQKGLGVSTHAAQSSNAIFDWWMGAKQAGDAPFSQRISKK